ncbi:MAG: N-6 DNA methylase [Bacteroidales bacterium]|nr:N-6 DNA methylase [Bacteroidales bacterium]
MNWGTNIEADYIRKTPLDHRKKFAQFFTPAVIADVMSDWLLGNDSLHSVLEPAFGLGVFSRCLLDKKGDLAIKGYDIDDRIFSGAQKEFSSFKNVTLLLQDYMYNDWENKYDGIICNPPYFKFHNYDNKSVLKEMEEQLSCRLNGFTNLYALFLLKSIHQLKDNGRCAYILPSEFLNSDYGALVKTYLIRTQTVRHIIVFDFEENIFDDALTTACIVLCANDKKSDYVQFTSIKSIGDIDIVKRIIEEYPSLQPHSSTYKIEELNPLIKWRSYYKPSGKNHYKNLVPFSDYAKVMRGIATGANDYFTFNLCKAKEYNIDEKYLLPCICHSTDVKGVSFTAEQFETLKRGDKKVFLFNAVSSKDTNVVKYINMGEEKSIDKRYLTANRKPWYSLEKRLPAPIWVSVFNRKGLRFVRNMTSVANLTTFHCIYPRRDMFTNVSLDLLFAYLISDTAREIFEDNSREYGNGLQKFEPNDLNKGMMLDLSVLPNEAKKEMERLYIENIDNPPIKEIDKILLQHFQCA